MSRLLSVSDVAELLGVTRQTIYQLRAAHKIPFVKIGSSVRFEEEQIKAWIKANTVEVSND